MTDPRFDARFQRGYDGPQPVPSAASAPPPGLRSVPPIPEATPLPRSPKLAEEVPVEPVSSHPAPAVVDEVEPWAPPRRNPFSLALLTASVILLVVGGWLLQLYATTVSNGFTPEEQMQAILQQQLAPALLVGGMVGVIAWLVLGALASLAARERR